MVFRATGLSRGRKGEGVTAPDMPQGNHRVLGRLVGLSDLSHYRLAWRRYRARRLARRANRARRRGDCAAAAALYQRALARDVGRTDIRVQLGHMLKELARFGEAEAAYRQALSQRPGDGDIHLQLGHLLKLLGRTEDAIVAYSAAYRLLNGSEASAAELHALGALAPGEHARQVEFHIEEGDRMRDSGRCEEAAEAYARALDLVPTRTDIRIQYGNMLKDCGQLAKAEAAYGSALATAPESAEIRLQLGHLFKLQGRRDEALAAYRRAADLQPSLTAAWAELADAGVADSLNRRFETSGARGSSEALLAMTAEVARLQAGVNRIVEALPALTGEIAFPLTAYDRFRALFGVPAPPVSGADYGFGIVLLAAETPLETLYAQLTAITAQTYQKWQLAVIGDGPAQRRAVERIACSDPRVGWIEMAADEPRAAAERRAAISLAADWLVLLAPGARLHRYALGWYAAAIGVGGAVAFISDEDTEVGSDGAARRLIPQLRQIVDYDTLLEANPFGETVAVQGAVYARASAAFVTRSPPAARTSLLLTLARNHAVGHIPLPLTVSSATEMLHSNGAPATVHIEAVQAHLDAADLVQRVVVEPAVDALSPLRIQWRPQRPNSLLEVIIPTRDNAADLYDMVTSLQRQASAPEFLRILIVDNGSRNGDTARVITALTTDDRVKVITLDEPFNWSRLNGRAAARSEADLLVFANDDMLMLTDAWDRLLRGLLERPEIGAVGARLIYPDDTLQHAGILLGWPNIDVHDGRYEPMSTAGPCRRWQVTRAVSAVTGAFLAVRRELFAASGGFDELDLPVAYGDIDFALRLRARGLRILWTPSITLRHHESKTRGLDHLDAERQARNQAERRIMMQRWSAALQIDPSINPTWHSASLPFKLISAPSQQRLWRHIRLTASGNPWGPEACRESCEAASQAPAPRPLP
jgi:O-antigen biosynthesis protein